MRRMLAILLLVAFSFQGIGYALVYKLQRRHFRQQMKAIIENSPSDDVLAKIVVPLGQESLLEWEHSKEFRYQDRMYDVVRTEVLPDGTQVFHCVADDDETLYLNGYACMLRNGQRHGHSQHAAAQTLLKLLFAVYFPVQVSHHLHASAPAIHFADQMGLPTCPAFKILSPPPQGYIHLA